MSVTAAGAASVGVATVGAAAVGAAAVGAEAVGAVAVSVAAVGAAAVGVAAVGADGDGGKRSAGVVFTLVKILTGLLKSKRGASACLHASHKHLQLSCKERCLAHVSYCDCMLLMRCIQDPKICLPVTTEGAKHVRASN